MKALLIDQVSEEPQALVARRDTGTDNDHPYWVCAKERGFEEPGVWRFKTLAGATYFMYQVLLSKVEWRSRMEWIALEVVTFTKVTSPLAEGGGRVMKKSTTCVEFWARYFYQAGAVDDTAERARP